jgi:hypothetical protein
VCREGESAEVKAQLTSTNTFAMPHFNQLPQPSYDTL